MAVLQPSTNHSHPFADQIGDALAPAGTFIATVVAVRDVFGIERQKFQSQEMEKVDLTCFLFGYRDAQGVPHKVASRQMRISGNEKSALFLFLKSLLGKAPAYGWDYCSLKGQKCLLTVEHVQRRDGSGVFAAIASLSPVPVGLGTPTGHSASAQPAPPRPAAPAPQPPPAAAPVEDDIPF